MSNQQRTSCILGALLTVGIAASAAHAQSCSPQFSDEFGMYRLNAAVRAIHAFNDGSGEVTVFGGDFSQAVPQGGPPINSGRIIAWDGVRFKAVGGGIAGTRVQCLTTFDDGTGPKLVVGGSFVGSTSGVAASNIVTWDGTQWRAMGAGFNAAVRALAVWDEDGAGPNLPHLYAAGQFTLSGSTRVQHIARWNGDAWEPLGSGLGRAVAPGDAGFGNALAVFDDGTGAALYVGGEFDIAGGVTAYGIASWDGSTFTPVGTGVTFDSPTAGGTVNALRVFDDGTGPALILGGRFLLGNTPSTFLNNVARWNGSTYQRLGVNGLPNTTINALGAFDSGQGSRLYASFDPTSIGGVGTILARLDPAGWTGIPGVNVGQGLALETANIGLGARLLLGGSFTVTSAQAPSPYLMAWEGMRYAALYSGLGPTSAVHASNLSGFEGLYAAGDFNTVNFPFPNRSFLARWRGRGWETVGPDLNQPASAVTTFDDGNGPAVYAAGRFMTSAGGGNLRGIARWNGTAWSNVGNTQFNLEVGRPVFVQWDEDGAGPGRTHLYLGGSISLFPTGGPSIGSLARWDGTAWSSVGLNPGGNITEMAVFDDGNGPALYAATSNALFPMQGAAIPFVGRWDGTRWTSTMGLSQAGQAYSLAVYDDGFGAALYALGTLSGPGASGPGLYRLIANGWVRVATVQGSPLGIKLAVADDGGGPGLYVVGLYSGIDGRTIPGFGFYRSGVWWTPLRSQPFQQGGPLGVSVLGQSMYFAGQFLSVTQSTNMGNVPISSVGVAEWKLCPRNPCPADLDDGSGTGTRDGGVTVEDLMYFLDAYGDGAMAADLDNGSGRGIRDGGVTIEDLIYYLGKFADGC